MPFKSQAQRSYLAIHNPDVAHKFAKDGSTAGKTLPYKVGGGLKHLFPRKKGK